MFLNDFAAVLIVLVNVLCVLLDILFAQRQISEVMIRWIKHVMFLQCNH